MVWFKVCFGVWNLALSSGLRFLFRFMGTEFMCLRLGVWVYGFQLQGTGFRVSVLGAQGFRELMYEFVFKGLGSWVQV